MRILIAIGVRREREAGAAGVVLNHARELEKLGHRVDCWFLEDILPREVRPARLQELIFAVRVAKRIARNRDQFEVVNLHAPWGCIYGLWRRFFRRAGTPPYVMTMQGSEERYSVAMRAEHRKGRAWHFSWKNRLWHRIYHQEMYRYSITSADFGVVANREGWVMTQLTYRRPPARMCFVPNGVEETFFISRNYAQREANRLLYVGTWLDRKGIFYLAEAFALAEPKIPGISLTVAGCAATEDAVRSSFAPALRHRVSVIPFIKRESMVSLYAQHDIFVFPSLVEGMPLTLLEAMASGMPVTTTDTCGMADVVEDGINGLLVPPADAQALAASIERLCQSAELRRGLGQAAQSTMRRYTWGLVVKKLEGVLKLAAESKTMGTKPC